MAEHASQNSRSGGHILVVEDDVAIAEMLITVLEMENYVVTWAGSGADALRLLCPHPPPNPASPLLYSLVLLDLQLMDMDGVEIVKRLRHIGCPIPPVLVLSAKTNRAVEAAAEEIGAAGVLNKPFFMNVLLDTVRQVIAQ